MNLSRNQIIIVGAGLLIVLVVVLGILGIIPIFQSGGQSNGDPDYPTGKVKLVIWGVQDTSASFDTAFQAYKAAYKNVEFQYIKFDSPEKYQETLLNALAERKGPDIFMVHSSWVYENWGKLKAAPAKIVTTQTVAQLYPEVVSKDFVLSGNVFSLPLYLDSLALIYNKDIFNVKALVSPPANWDETVGDVLKIRELDESKKISLAALALGTSQNINNAPELLTLLMLQSGSFINPKDGSGVFFDANAQKALDFYLQFSDPINPYYTWNEGLDDSLSVFASGKVAMVIDFFGSLAKIKEKNPFLNFGTATLPQLKGALSYQQANVADYWGLAVSAQSLNPYAAWHFVRYLTTNSTAYSQYLQTAGHLPALKSLISQGLGGDNDAFLRGFLIAKTWQKTNYEKIGEILRRTITDILSGKIQRRQALKAAEGEINALY
ncbi:MAG: Extracellular solute-binding protein family 1 [Parcubacteria group bacterium GW2011_GWB1_43_8b]|nr:MAG: Extracellular solute-binding protein family 1 [Parcubacteria group bacterium GW2011_GWB1_43_8b]